MLIPKPRRKALAVILLAVIGTQTSAEPPMPQTQDAAPPGSDRDSHGCIPSAGYTWCARTNRCERPWELSQEHSFEPTQEAFDAYCENPER
jgi:hypothetical protein